MKTDTLPTRRSLLLRLRDLNNHAAWRELDQVYSGLIVGYARKNGCPQAMAEDILQRTMVALTKRMPTFDYQPHDGRGFRSYLLHIVHACMVDEFRRESRYVHPQPPDGTEPGDYFAGLPTGASGREQDDAWDQSWLENVLVLALRRTRSKIKAGTYRNFRAYVVEDRPAEAVAVEAQIDRNALYQQASRVQKILCREARAILRDAGEPAALDPRQAVRLLRQLDEATLLRVHAAATGQLTAVLEAACRPSPRPAPAPVRRTGWFWGRLAR